MMIENAFTRLWEDLISPPAGPLKFRFLLQPAMAIVLAVRSGLKDSREGKPAYFWALFVDPTHPWELLRRRLGIHRETFHIDHITRLRIPGHRPALDIPFRGSCGPVILGDHSLPARARTGEPDRSAATSQRANRRQDVLEVHYA